MFMARQGDVLLIGCKYSKTGAAKTRPRDARGRLVLAYGEITGHAHAIEDALADLFDEEDGRLYLRVGGDAAVALQHEEHATVTVAPGDYEVRQQREYTPQAIRRVSD